jgi:hypothetical protein
MPTTRLSMRRIHQLMTLRFGAGAATRAKAAGIVGDPSGQEQADLINRSVVVVAEMCNWRAGLRRVGMGELMTNADSGICAARPSPSVWV